SCAIASAGSGHGGVDGAGDEKLFVTADEANRGGRQRHVAHPRTINATDGIPRITQRCSRSGDICFSMPATQIGLRPADDVTLLVTPDALHSRDVAIVSPGLRRPLARLSAAHRN